MYITKGKKPKLKDHQAILSLSLNTTEISTTYSYIVQIGEFKGLDLNSNEFIEF